MIIKLISIDEVGPYGVVGAHVYIANVNKELIFFVGSIHDTSLIHYYYESEKLTLKYLKKVYFLCVLYFNADHAIHLKKDIEVYRNNAELNENDLQGLEILETAADFVIKNRARNYYMYIIGD